MVLLLSYTLYTAVSVPQICEIRKLAVKEQQKVSYIHWERNYKSRRKTFVARRQEFDFFFDRLNFSRQKGEITYIYLMHHNNTNLLNLFLFPLQCIVVLSIWWYDLNKNENILRADFHDWTGLVVLGRGVQFLLGLDKDRRMA